MNKSLIALAVLGAVSGVATAQSSVTFYGRVDQAYGKPLAAMGLKAVSGLMDTSGSRIGVRGTEDLGGGLKAVFNLEHRLSADTGEAGYVAPFRSSNNAAGGTAVTAAVPGASTSFWGARAVVGLEGGFGRILLGREYTAAFLGLENPMDPWKGDTMATAKPLTLGNNIEVARFSNSINYALSASGITFMASWAPKEDGTPAQSTATLKKASYSTALNYAAGPIFVGIAYTNPGYDNDHWADIAGSYNFGMVKVGAFFGNGKSAANRKVSSWMLTAVAPIGNGELRTMYGQLRSKNQTTGVSDTLVKKLSVGYWYSLSKRTTLYGDLISDNGKSVKDAAAAGFGQKTAYEFGIKHDF